MVYPPSSKLMSMEQNALKICYFPSVLIHCITPTPDEIWGGEKNKLGRLRSIWSWAKR